MRAKLVSEYLNESKNYTNFAQQEWDPLTQEQKLDILLQYVKDPDDAEFYSTVEDVNDLPDDIGTNVRGYLEHDYEEDTGASDDFDEEESGVPDHYPESGVGDWNWR